MRQTIYKPHNLNWLHGKLRVGASPPARSSLGCAVVEKVWIKRQDCGRRWQSGGLVQFFSLFGVAGEAFVAGGIVFVLDRRGKVEERSGLGGNWFCWFG